VSVEDWFTIENLASLCSVLSFISVLLPAHLVLPYCDSHLLDRVVCVYVWPMRNSTGKTVVLAICVWSSAISHRILSSSKGAITFDDIGGVIWMDVNGFQGVHGWLVIICGSI